MNTFLNTSKTMTRRGFTLVESLVAISILLVAIAAPLTLVIQSLKLSNYASTRMVAGFLAQDAFEYIRNIKDTNALAGKNQACSINSTNDNLSNCWLAGIDTGCFTTDGCAVDTTADISSAFSACGSSGCPALRRNSTSYAYTLNGSDPVTIFTRTIQITDSVNSPVDDKFVIVTMSWSVDGFTKSITTQTSLRDWH